MNNIQSTKLIEFIKSSLSGEKSINFIKLNGNVDDCNQVITSITQLSDDIIFFDKELDFSVVNNKIMILKSCNSALIKRITGGDSYYDETLKEERNINTNLIVCNIINFDKICHNRCIMVDL